MYDHVLSYSKCFCHKRSKTENLKETKPLPCPVEWLNVVLESLEDFRQRALLYLYIEKKNPLQSSTLQKKKKKVIVPHATKHTNSQ